MTDTKLDTSTAQVKQRTEWLRLHRLDVAVASTRMPWCPDWPLDRLSVQVADDADALASERDALKEEAEKFRTAARVLCGAHIGVPQVACPVCELQALAHEHERLKGVITETRNRLGASWGVASVGEERDRLWRVLDDALRATPLIVCPNCFQMNGDHIPQCPRATPPTPAETRPVRCARCGKEKSERVMQPGESALTSLVWYCSMECGLD